VTRVRVFLPCTLPRLKAALAAGEVGPAPVVACAVTSALREWYAEGDDEELEYVAMAEAARASLRLLDGELVADPSAPPRRVVLAADVDASAVTRRTGAGAGGADASGPGAGGAVAGGAEGTRAAVTLSGPVPLSAVVSAHVDDAEAEDAVAAAAASVVAAEMGSDDARFALDEAEGHELLWWHPSEFELLVLDLP
jgi:hypothetical protein